jgi:hypothetical protein
MALGIGNHTEHETGATAAEMDDDNRQAHARQAATAEYLDFETFILPPGAIGACKE